MALDTYSGLWNKVKLWCPSASPLLARTWVSHAFRQLAERRLWSWLMKYGQFTPRAVYSTGTVACTRGSTDIVGTSTVWDSTMVDCQFRIGTATPIYTISTVTDATHITLSSAWGPSDTTGSSYEIYNAYVTAPTDFLSFVSVTDPNYNWQLNLTLTAQDLDRIDAQRSNSGNAYSVVPRDYYTPSGGTVPVPRYEIWPHQKAEYVYPYLYISRPTDLEDSGATLPRYIRGDVLLNMALAECCRWPGTEDKKNPMFSIPLASMYDKRAEEMIVQLERQDDEIFEADATYQALQYPYAPYPTMDSVWLQKHDFPI